MLDKKREGTNLLVNGLQEIIDYYAKEGKKYDKDSIYANKAPSANEFAGLKSMIENLEENPDNKTIKGAKDIIYGYNVILDLDKVASEKIAKTADGDEGVAVRERLSMHYIKTSFDDQKIDYSALSKAIKMGKQLLSQNKAQDYPIEKKGNINSEQIQDLDNSGAITARDNPVQFSGDLTSTQELGSKNNKRQSEKKNTFSMPVRSKDIDSSKIYTEQYMADARGKEFARGVVIEKRAKDDSLVSYNSLEKNDIVGIMKKITSVSSSVVKASPVTSSSKARKKNPVRDR